MKAIESIILLSAIVGVASWTVISAKDGYKQDNAMIVARSIDIASTIDGEVENKQLAVGSKLQANQVMVKIRDTRVDHSRATQLKTKVEYLKLEINNNENKKNNLDVLLINLKQKQASYKRWLIKDLHLKKDIKARERQVAEQQKLLKTQDVKRLEGLFKKQIISVDEFHTAKAKAEIARNQLKVTTAELARITLSLESVENQNIFFENGDASYWQKNIDELNLKALEINHRIDELHSQLMQFSAQEVVELGRLNTDFVEEHRAPFSGIVNAVYITKGSHVKSGTVLMQVLDCTNPVVIVPIPESRFSDFSIGKKVVINPIDSDHAIAGTIKYISSGPLISLDKTIALRQELTAKGTHAVISFDHPELRMNIVGSCDTTRRAIVTIETHSIYDKITDWVNLYLGGSLKAEAKIAESQTFPDKLPSSPHSTEAHEAGLNSAASDSTKLNLIEGMGLSSRKI